MPHTVEPIANYRCLTGENPLWDERAGVFYWTDIPNGKLYRYDPATGEHGEVYRGEPVGGFTFQQDGSLLLFRVNDVATFRVGEEPRVVIEYTDDDMERFNDCVAAPDGGVFAGTIGRTDSSGGLYRVDVDGRVTQLFKQTRVANGMAFTADRRRFYWTDSRDKRIYLFDYDERAGAIANRRVFLDTSDLPGTPDGMTLDTEGNIYCARWSGHAVLVFSPDGEQIDRIDTPPANASSCVFGGLGMDELYITTAAAGQTDDPDAGTLYRVKLPAKGLPEHRSRVCL